MAQRLEAAGEETVLALFRDDESEAARARRLLLVARREEGGAILEFVTGPGAGNLQDRIAMLGDQTKAAIEREVSLRLLQHLASSVRHQQYHDTDVVTIRVQPPTTADGAHG